MVVGRCLSSYAAILLQTASRYIYIYAFTEYICRSVAIGYQRTGYQSVNGDTSLARSGRLRTHHYMLTVNFRKWDLWRKRDIVREKVKCGKNNLERDTKKQCEIPLIYTAFPRFLFVSFICRCASTARLMRIGK